MRLGTDTMGNRRTDMASSGEGLAVDKVLKHCTSLANTLPMGEFPSLYNGESMYAFSHI